MRTCGHIRDSGNLHVIKFKQMTQQTESKPTEMQMHHAMQSYIDALNAKNVEGIIALFAENGTIEDPVGSVVENARSGLTRLVGALPEDATFTLDTSIRTSYASGAAMAFTVELTLDGKKITIHSIDVMQFNSEGLITEMKAYYGPGNVVTV